jgi:ADP-sugar diphosphatase
MHTLFVRPKLAVNFPLCLSRTLVSGFGSVRQLPTMASSVSSFSDVSATRTTVTIHGDTVPVAARAGIDIEQAIAFVPFKDWCSTMDNTLKVCSVEITDIDYFGPRVGFLKFKAEVELNGVRVPGIVFARGGAVAILVVIKSEGKKWALCCKQARVPCGKSAFIEIPAGEGDPALRFGSSHFVPKTRLPICAGMMDGSGHFAGVAAKELEEETGVVVTSDKLFDMTAAVYPGERGWYPSVGACDEFLRLMYFAVDMSRAELEELRGKTTGGFAGENS